MKFCLSSRNFLGFSQIFAVFHGFQLLSRQVFWKQVRISLPLTRFIPKQSIISTNTSEYLTFLSLSLSLLCENGAGAIASAPFYTTAIAPVWAFYQEVQSKCTTLFLVVTHQDAFLQCRSKLAQHQWWDWNRCVQHSKLHSLAVDER